MKYNEIKAGTINSTNDSKVRELANSIRQNGWIGCPILTYDNILVTGSHRLEALRLLEEEEFDVQSLGEVAEDVTDIIDEALEEYAEENECDIDEIEWDQSNIGWLLKDSWVEEYKGEIEEW
jgi:glutaredoxin